MRRPGSVHRVKDMKNFGAGWIQREEIGCYEVSLSCSAESHRSNAPLPEHESYQILKHW